MKRIVVVGAGFGGLEAATQLDRMFRKNSDVDILLVSDQNYLLFTPLLPQIASSYTDPRHIVQAVREIRGRRRFRFRREAVRAVDAPNRRLIFDTESLEYDALILAPGARTEFFNIPGAAENSWDYKSLQQAVELRERIIDMCEHADHTEDPAARKKMLTFVVVGGGYTGIELVTEMHDFLARYVARRVSGHPPVRDAVDCAGSGAGRSTRDRAEARRPRPETSGKIGNRGPHVHASHARARNLGGDQRR